MAKKRVVVTGAAGYVAQRMLPELRRALGPGAARRAGHHPRRQDGARPDGGRPDEAGPQRVSAALPGRGRGDPLRLRARARARRAPRGRTTATPSSGPSTPTSRSPTTSTASALEEGVRRVVVCSSNHAADYYERLVWDGRLDMVTPEMPPRSDNWYGWAKAAYELLGFVFATGKVDGRKLEIVQWRIGGPARRRHRPAWSRATSRSCTARWAPISRSATRCSRRCAWWRPRTSATSTACRS